MAACVPGVGVTPLILVLPSRAVMCQPLEVVANVTPTPTVPPAKTKPTQGNRPDSAPLERVLTIGYARRGPLIHSVAKEPTEQPQTQPERFTPRLNLKAPSGQPQTQPERFTPRLNLKAPSGQPQTQPELRRGPLKLPSMGCVERTTEQQQELKPDRPLPPLASLADSAPDHPKPHSRSTGFGLTDTDVCVSLANTDDEAERKPAFVGISRDGKDEMLPVSDNVEPLAKPIKSSSPESFSLPEKGAEQQAVVDGDDTEIPIKTSQEDKPDVAEVENAPLTAFQRIVIEGLERRTPPPGPLDPSSPPQLDDAPAAVEVARKVTVLEVASQASHLPSPVSSDHEAEAPEQEKPLDHGVEPKQANASENDEDLLGRLLDDAALLPLEKGDQSISDKVGRHVDHEVAAGQAEAELLLSPVPEPVVAAELVFSPPSVFPAEQNQVEPDVQAEDIDLAPVPVSTQDEKDRLVSRWRVGLDQAVGEGDGPSQERLQEDNNVRPLDATQEEKDKLIARWHAELAQAAEGDPDQLDGGALDDLAMAFDLEHDNTGVVEDSQCARSDQGPEIVEDSAFMDEEAHDNAEAAGEAELPVEALPVGEATKDRSSSPAEEALSEDEELGAGPSAHDSEAEVEDEVELDEQDDVEAEVDEEDDAEADVDSEAGVEYEVEEDDEDEDEFEAGAEVEDACEVDEEEEFEVDGQEHFEVDAEGDFFDDSSYSEHDQQDGDDEQQPFEEARALLDVIDRKEPRVAAALLNIMKDLAENKIDLDARYDEANASNARATASRVDGDDEEQEEADVDEINSACSGSSDRVDQALEDREEDLQEEAGGQSSYDDGGDSAGDDHDAEEGFRVHVQGLPEDANSESDGAFGLLNERLP